MTTDRAQRAHRVARSMLAQGVEQTLIASPYTIRYLTGCDVDAGERVNILLLHADGSMVWLVNALCAPKNCEDAALQIYRDGEDALALLAGMLRPGRVGVEHALFSGFLLELMEKKPGLRPVNATPAIARVRMIKDEEELVLLRRSSAGNDRALERALNCFDPAMSEREFGMFLLDQYEREDMYTCWPPLVCFGAGAAEPHHASGKARVREGDAIVVDTGADYRGYASDMTRTVFYRRADEEQRRVYETVLEANLAAIDAVKPGVALDELDRIARSVIEKAGCGEFFTHRCGHSIGVEGHEFPTLGGGDGMSAEKNMCFSIEPGIYLPGRFGVRIEDLVIVTENGAEVINHMDKKLRIIGK